MNLALDISTSVTGVSILNDTGEIISKRPIILNKIKNTLGTEDVLFKKSEVFADYFKTLKGINTVIIEEPLQNGPNVFTTNILIRFNGMVSLLAHQILGVIPIFLSVHEVRSLVCSEFLKVGPKSKVTLSFPPKIDKKAYIFDKIQRWFPDEKWETNKKGEIAKENLDISDSIAVNLAYLINSNKLTLKDLNSK